MSYFGPERRKTERIRRQFTVRMRRISGNIAGDWDLVLLKDISKSSLSFHHDRAFQEGDLLDLKISIGVDPAPVVCRGEVARVDAAGVSVAHEVAAVFIDISPQDMDRIQKTIDEQKKAG